MAFKFTITDCSNFDKQCSGAHFVSLLFYYYCKKSKTSFKISGQILKWKILMPHLPLCNMYHILLAQFSLKQCPPIFGVDFFILELSHNTTMVFRFKFMAQTKDFLFKSLLSCYGVLRFFLILDDSVLNTYKLCFVFYSK